MGRRGRPRYPDILTPREWEVLALLRKNLTNEAIAARLGVTHAAAKYHVSEILSKLGVSTREEAAAWQPEASRVAAAREPPTRRPWWASALGWLRPVTLAKATLITAAVAVLAGLGVLAWGVLRTDGEGSFVAQPSPSRIATIMPTSASPDVTSTAVPTPPPSLDLGVYSIASDGSALQTLLPGFKIRDVTPDGRYIAGAEFCSAPGHLELANSLSRSTRQLATFDGIVARIEIAPNGNQVLVAVLSREHPRTPLLYLVPTGDNSSPLSLFEGWDAEWSPSSRYIRFINAPVTGESTLSVYEVATGANTSLVSAPQLSSAIWSPDSTLLAYSEATDVTGAIKRVWLWDLTAGVARSLPSNGVPVTWFPDGQSIAVLEPGGQNSPLTRVWVDGSRSEPLGESSGFAISPDGATVARRIFTEVQKTELRITRDGVETLVSGSAEPAGDMAFSPDSQTLAFIAQEYTRDQGGQIIAGTGVNPYVVAADGSNPRKLADTVQSEILGWTPDGSVLFASVRGVGCEDPFG